MGDLIHLHRTVEVSPWNAPESFEREKVDAFELLRERQYRPTLRDDLREVLSDSFFIFFLGGSCGCLLTVVAAALWAGVL